MLPVTALSILRALADGIDPHSGEVFPAGSPWQHPDTVRALFAAIAALEVSESRPARRADLPLQAGKAWNAEEDAHLREGFAAGSTAAELAEAHARSVGAIRSRLVRLGLISERDQQP